MDLIELHENWKFREQGQGDWLPATVPGCVHTDLLKNQRIPDPFYRDNEKKLQWIEKKNWEYETTFHLTRAQLKKRQANLIFKGLDTYAGVFLNNHSILKANNMFREWRTDVRPFLREGENVLRIVFHSPTREISPRLKKLPYILPSAHDQESKTSPYTRKAPYQFGWDWGPRFVTMGIWRPVFLEFWDEARLVDVWIRQKKLSEEKAELVAQIEIQAEISGSFELTVESPTGAFDPVTKEVVAEPGAGQYAIDFEIDLPTLWWPNGMGEPFLYAVRVTLKTEGQVLDQAQRRIGLRTLELRQRPDKWGKSFEFVVNGRPVFAKGGNWIPADSFPPRVSEAHYRHLLQSSREAHMNMIRVWGGGIYEADIFYDLCDEMGLLVWQDFMFACSLYPGDETFLENVRLEAIDQIKRLRNHPSLALWCGNNEIEASWREWGWNKNLPDEVWENYLKLFHRVLPNTCAEWDPDRPYWPSSPSSNLEETPSSPRMGDVHFWDVWHRGKPFEAYQEVQARFVSEYGFQSFPEMATVRRFSLPEDWRVDSPVMLAHQKDGGGNQRIQDYMKLYYKEPRDFASFLYVSQILQAQGIKSGAEHFRRMRPRCMGSLYWQINDCWPVASWSSIDYFGRWKALHYYARRFYAPLLVSPVESDGVIHIFVVSDAVASQSGHLRAELLSLTGEVLWKKEKLVHIPAGSSGVYLEMESKKLLELGRPEELVLISRLQVGENVLSENAWLFVPPKELALREPHIRAKIASKSNGFSLRLTSKTFARDVFLTTKEFEGHFSDNFFDLIPNHPREIYFETKEKIAVDDFRERLRITSLFDVF